MRLLSGEAQRPPDVVLLPGVTLDRMEKHFRAPIGHKARWAAGVTLAGVIAGAAFAAVFAAVATTGSTASAASSVNSARTTELDALLSASNAAPPADRMRPLRRLRRFGGEYGTFTVTTKEGTRTLAFERGTIESVSGSDVVIRAANGTTMTWLLVSDTVVRDHGESTRTALAKGELVFAGGPVAADGVRDARLVVVRTAKPTAAPATSAS